MRILLLGAGHVHLSVMAAIGRLREAGHEVCVVGPGEHHYYSGMGPGMLGGRYTPEQIRFNVKAMVENRGGVFVKDQAVRIDPASRTVRLASGAELSYDVASLNVGSVIPPLKTDPGAPFAGEVFKVKPIEELLALKKRLETAGGVPKVCVVGGGPAGVEVAGNTARLMAGLGREVRIKLLAGRGLLRRHAPRFRAKCRESLMAMGVLVVEDGYVEGLSPQGPVLEGGRVFDAEVVVNASGVRPPPLIADSGLAGPDGALPVNGHLQCPEHPELFGGGDCVQMAHAPMDRVGVHAVRENPILLHNLQAFAEGEPLRSYEPVNRYLLIVNPGDDRGVFVRGGLVSRGAFWMWLKDRIDSGFMKKFQAMEREKG